MILATVAKELETFGVMTGNVMANTQKSFFVRPAHETECNGFTFPAGALQQSDLNAANGARRHGLITDRTIKMAAELADKHATDSVGVVLSIHFYRNASGRLTPLGVCIYTIPNRVLNTDWQAQDIKILYTSYMASNCKQAASFDAIHSALEAKVAEDAARWDAMRHEARTQALH